MSRRTKIVLVVAGALVIAAVTIVALKPHSPVYAEENNEEALQSTAKALGDSRSGKQARIDNALVEAASKGDIDGIKAALKSGASIDARYIDMHAFLSAGQNGYTPLMIASARGQADAVHVLIEAKADLNLERNGRTSLYYAARANHAAVVDLLVNAGAKGDAAKIRLAEELIVAACRGFELKNGEGYPKQPGAPKLDPREESIEDILAKGADVNATDIDGNTALMYAANLMLFDNVAVLLKKGADPTLKNKYDDTALSLAKNSNSNDVEARGKILAMLKEALAKKP